MEGTHTLPESNTLSLIPLSLSVNTYTHMHTRGKAWEREGERLIWLWAGWGWQESLVIAIDTSEKTSLHMPQWHQAGHWTWKLTTNHKPGLPVLLFQLSTAGGTAAICCPPGAWGPTDLAGTGKRLQEKSQVHRVRPGARQAFTPQHLGSSLLASAALTSVPPRWATLLGRAGRADSAKDKGEPSETV